MPPRKKISEEVQEEALLELYSREPQIWRNNLLIDTKTGPRPWGEMLVQQQLNDFAALDAALKSVAQVPNYVAPPGTKQRFWIQRSRGYSKSTDIASCIAWLVAFSRRKIEGVIAAEDRDQARFVREQLLELLQYNSWMQDRGYLKILKNEIICERTNSVMHFITSDAASSFGAKPTFTLATEFTHWTSEAFWNSILSSAAKTFDKGGLLLIDCNAGEGTDWKWRQKMEAATSGLWYHSAPAGYAPWYSEETIQEQARSLTFQQYRRLWHNEWQASDGEFLSLNEADACIDPQLVRKEKADSNVIQYIATIDYAEKNDLTSGCVGHLEGGQIIVDRMDVLDPKYQTEGIVKVDWVRNWIRNIQQIFGADGREVIFLVDPYQLLGVCQELEGEVVIERFEFGSGKGNFEVANYLRKAILARKVSIYPGCGSIYDAEGRVVQPNGMRNDLCTELAQLLIKKQGLDRWRFVHKAGEHDDRAFTLGLLVWFIVTNTDSSFWETIISAGDGRFRI